MNIVARTKALMLDVGASPIMYLMIALSVLSLAVILERAYFFFTVRENLERLAVRLAALLREGDFDAAKALLEKSRSVEAAIVLAGIAEADGGAEAAAEAMAGATSLQRMRLERRLAFLGTLGNNAPFIGLLGTVIGIVQAFDKLGEAGRAAANSAAGAPSEVMGSIAEALVATAIGLVVAIPAVAVYNYFQRRIKSTLSNSEALSHLLLAKLKGQHEFDLPARIPGRASQPQLQVLLSDTERLRRLYPTTLYQQVTTWLARPLTMTMTASPASTSPLSSTSHWFSRSSSWCAPS